MKANVSENSVDAMNEMISVAKSEKLRIGGVVSEEDKIKGQKPAPDIDVYLDKSESKDKWHTVSKARTDLKGAFSFEDAEIETGTDYRVRFCIAEKAIETLFINSMDKVKDTIEIKLLIPACDDDACSSKDKEESQSDKLAKEKADICEAEEKWKKS